jgi:hypothetical protein
VGREAPYSNMLFVPCSDLHDVFGRFWDFFQIERKEKKLSLLLADVVVVQQFLVIGV